MPIVISPLLVPPAGGVAPLVGYSLGEYRRRIATETGNFVASQVSNASTTYLQDLRYPVRSNLDQGDLYTGKWLLRPDATDDRDKTRVVSERGYDPGTGTIRPDSPWFTNPVTDERYELHGVIEPWTQMIDLVNQALKRCMVVDHVVVPVTPGITSVNLTPYAPWLLDRRWVRGAAFVDPTLYNDPSDIDMLSQPTFRGFAEQHGRALLLRWQNWDWPASAQNVLVVRCIRRAFDYCREDASGTFGERQGLDKELNEAVPDPDWVCAAAMTDFWDQFGDVVAAGNRQEAETNQGKWANTFTSMTQQFFTLPPYTLLAPVKAGWWVGRY